MTEPTDFEVSHAYTRQAVEEYMAGVEAQRIELLAAIAHARARAARAVEVKQRIASLEHRVGEWIVTAHAQDDRRTDRAVTPPRPRFVPGSVPEAESG